MESLLFMALAGAITTGVVEFAKKFDVDAKVSMGLVAIAAALAYVFFTELAPEYVVQFVLSVWGTAVVFYEFIVKKLLSS